MARNPHRQAKFKNSEISLSHPSPDCDGEGEAVARATAASTSLRLESPSKEQGHMIFTLFDKQHQLSTKHSSPRTRYRPRVEALEDRVVPTTLTVTSPDDNVAEMHTLRWAVAHADSGDEIQIVAALKDTPIVLTQGELVLNQSVIIEGVGNVPETISGGGNSRIFEIAAGVHVTLENLTLTGGDGLANNPAGSSSWDQNGGAILNFGTLALLGVTASGNTAFVEGGAIYNAGALSVSGSTLADNTVPFGNVTPLGVIGGGGAIFNSGTVRCSQSTLSNNTVSFDGGAIFSTGAVTLQGCTLNGNTAFFDQPSGTGGYGGAIVSSGTLSIADCTLDNNLSFGGGGAIDCSVQTTITNSTLLGNTCIFTGGAIFNSGTLTVNGCTVSGNTSEQSGGGGIFNDGTLTVSSSSFTGNFALSGGGGIYNDFNSTATVTNSAFSGNFGRYGGGIFNYGTVAISGCTLSGNDAFAGGGYGGGFCNFGVATVSGCTVTGNIADVDGGGIYNASTATLTMSGTFICDNTPDQFVNLGAFIDGGGNTIC
jgi:predicted outer membrane repeat protein